MPTTIVISIFIRILIITIIVTTGFVGSFDPHFLVFEFVTGFLLRPRQDRLGFRRLCCRVLGRPLGYLILSLMALIRDPID